MSAAKTDSEQWLYVKGKQADYFVLVLEGRVEVTIGVEGLTFEAGPFNYYGVPALDITSKSRPLLPVTAEFRLRCPVFQRRSNSAVAHSVRFTLTWHCCRTSADDTLLVAVAAFVAACADCVRIDEPTTWTPAWWRRLAVVGGAQGRSGGGLGAPARRDTELVCDG